jgi:hypothetical protein
MIGSIFILPGLQSKIGKNEYLISNSRKVEKDEWELKDEFLLSAMERPNDMAIEYKQQKSQFSDTVRVITSQFQ